MRSSLTIYQRLLFIRYLPETQTLDRHTFGPAGRRRPNNRCESTTTMQVE